VCDVDVWFSGEVDKTNGVQQRRWYCSKACCKVLLVSVLLLLALPLLPSI
jgi:hypothetical protein